MSAGSSEEKIQMIEYSSNLSGYLSEANLLPSRSSISPTSLDMVKKCGLYDANLSKFQTTIATLTENALSNMPLPAGITKEAMILAAVKSSTMSLKARPDLLSAIQKSRYGQTNAEGMRRALSNVHNLFQAYKKILSQMEHLEFRVMLKSNMPSSYFSESVLAYRSAAFFVDQEFEKIYKRLSMTVRLYKANRKKLEPALDYLQKQNSSEMFAFNQLGTFHSKLKLYVNLWNTGSAEKAFEFPTSVDFGKLRQDTYNEFFRLFRENLLLFRRKIVRDYPKDYCSTVEKRADEPTQVMWRELLQPLVAQ
jgi:hypothetical protein